MVLWLFHSSFFTRTHCNYNNLSKSTTFMASSENNFCELPIGTVCVADVYDITEAVKDICERNGLPYIDVRIKWQNDLYLNGFKVGGVLCTSNYKSKKFNVSAGFQTLEELYYKTCLHSGQSYCTGKE
ncbi:putative carbon--nitrogen ligase [Lupinus albus]|uniref:Putative carbon--nitrogen ligase n=1 Tax=Lupinus albus TaxID=3870 RepID=A0A6A4PQV5_LUPAL|nr:putative carbon--nitrogen ligase [Lupinus albus]